MTEQEIEDRIENKICLECGKPISKDYKYFCEDCYESSMKKVIESGFNGNDWVWWVTLLGIFSGKGEEFSNKTLKEDKKDDKNDGN
jgi:predicted amidophosphoribosyltransferase